MHVVIVGGGFAGIKTALELSKRHTGSITLISDRSYFLHQATLYATATGKSTEESVIPLPLMFAEHRAVEIVEDSIESLDPQRHLIRGEHGTYHYDKLVLALGSTTSFKGIKGLSRHAFGVSTLDEVREFQDHIHDSIVTKQLDPTFYVIGAGLTGVEVAAALHEHVTTLASLYRRKKSNAKVVLVEAESRILPHASKTASRLATKHLERIGVTVRVDHTVTELNETTITVNGRLSPSSAAIWTSGATNNPFYTKNKGYFSLNKAGRVMVNPYLEALDDVYVIGDNNDVHYSGMALPALRQAKHVAKNISRLAAKRVQLPFRPSSVPVSFPVGARWGYAEWYGLYVAGVTGKTVRRLMELHSYCQLLPLKSALPIWRSHDVTDVDDRF